jgi:hypothetical protein
MLYDIAFLILSTCLHLNDSSFEISRQCQEQLTACYNEAHTRAPQASVDAVISYCLVGGHVNWQILETKTQK